MKERLTALLLLFLALLTVWAVVTELPKDSESYGILPSASPEDVQTVSGIATSPLISSEVIRLHILADSDSDADQAIKLKVRDVLLPYLNAATLSATTKEEALSMLSSNCGLFTEIANQVLAASGVSYTATVDVKSVYFPIRIYGSQTYLSEDAIIFPPGFYDSVQVILGTGSGHNWWCLAYPSLCFIDSSYDYIPKDSDLYKKKIGTVDTGALWDLFYGHEMPIKPSNGETTIYYGSKLWELVKSLFQKYPFCDRMGSEK